MHCSCYRSAVNQSEVRSCLFVWIILRLTIIKRWDNTNLIKLFYFICRHTFELLVYIQDDANSLTYINDPITLGLLTQDDVFLLFDDVSKRNHDGSLTPVQNGEFGDISVTQVRRYGLECFDWIICSWGGRAVLTVCCLLGLAIVFQGCAILWEIFFTIRNWILRLIWFRYNICGLKTVFVMYKTCGLVGIYLWCIKLVV